jgi:phosphopantothenoylcysteine decarboxylase/phosphopantothenate--cysteine ligase
LHILVGVTGGIAAFKAAGVIRGFTELGHTVKVLPTQNALRFIGATTLEALSHNVVDSDLYTDVDSVKHIALAQEADLIVVAPATAAFIARYAYGLADDLLLNVLLATKAKVVVAPAMHTEMWQHPATVANIKTLKSRGVKIIEPATGRLTGDDSGPGRLPEPDEIVASALSSVQAQDLSGKTVTIAAGGTREPIDTVRFIGNRSSGKQGIALADAALARGAKVNLIAINIDTDLSRFANVTRVSTTAELSTVLDQMLPVSDVIYMPAAVSDYRVANIEPGKLSRHDASEIELKLIANPDLLSGLSEKRNALGLKAILVGFAAEVLSSSGNRDELNSKANAKLHKKNVDLIVANDVSNGAVFDQDSNQVLILSSSGSIESHGSKLEVASQIIDETVKLFG